MTILNKNRSLKKWLRHSRLALQKRDICRDTQALLKRWMVHDLLLELDTVGISRYIAPGQYFKLDTRAEYFILLSESNSRVDAYGLSARVHIFLDAELTDASLVHCVDLCE